MMHLSMNARSAGSGSMRDHVFPWKWNLTDLEKIENNGLTVFSCFSCGGGSTMGYKLAGYKVLGDCEIDRDMNKLYVTNHHPKHNYLMDIRDFCDTPNDNLPEELFSLDVLDGSPPCSVFSTAGEREKGWNKEKQFREGQKLQRLDDLFFAYIDVANKLKPKVVAAENVRGLTVGNAKGYVNEIFHAFKEAGYVPQMFLLNACKMGVPQKRSRVFFIAHRDDLDLPKIKMDFNEPEILFGDVRSENGVKINPATDTYKLIEHRKPTDRKLSDINLRLNGKDKGFTNYIYSDERVCGTIASGGSYFRMKDGEMLSRQDIINVQSFPQDYNFLDQNVQYVCGMSVPPVMMANIARQIKLQWFDRYIYNKY